jgi:hypothetical protein
VFSVVKNGIGQAQTCLGEVEIEAEPVVFTAGIVNPEPSDCQQVIQWIVNKGGNPVKIRGCVGIM